MSEWISVKDKLPDYEGEYIVFDSLNNKVHHDYFVIPENHTTNGYSKRPFFNHYSDNVTHWMSLPNPPEIK